MLHRKRLIVLLCLACLPVVAARRSASQSRGGFGFLYPDANSFSNPGMFASLRGTSLEAMYSRVNNSSLQSVTPSVVYGDGVIGVGAFGSRTTTDFGSAGVSQDSIGAGIGVGLGKGRASLGLSYTRSIDSAQSNDGTILSTVTIHSKKARFGIGASTSLNDVARDRQSGIVAAGFVLSPVLQTEVTAKVNDFANWNDFTGSVFLNAVAQQAYAGLGYGWVNAINSHQAQARLGIVIGRTTDVSLYATHLFGTGREPLYGGSLRAIF